MVRRTRVVFLAVSILLLVSLAFDLSLGVSRGRSMSASQLVENVLSISGASAGQDLSGSREWRLGWWRTIVSYTLHGEYFWTGKGFGVNLADVDGFQVGDGTLRSPHNGHLTILARMGVPGLAAWTMLLVLLVTRLLRSSRAARRAGDDTLARTCIWLLAYLGAFLVNAAFDVALEGPQAGIWFWCLCGLGLGAARLSLAARRPE